MAATSETELIEMLDKVEEKMRVHAREVAGLDRGVPVFEQNRDFLLAARNQIQEAISSLLRIKW